MANKPQISVALDTFLSTAESLYQIAEDAAFAQSQGQETIIVIDETTMNVSRLNAKEVVDLWMGLWYNMNEMLRESRVIEAGEAEDDNNAIN